MPSTQDEAKVFRGRSSKTFARASAAPGSEAFLSTGIFSTEFSDSSEQGVGNSSLVLPNVVNGMMRTCSPGVWWQMVPGCLLPLTT